MKWSKSVEKRGKNSPKNIQLKSCAGKNRLKFIFSYRLIVQQRRKGKEREWADEYGGFFWRPISESRAGRLAVWSSIVTMRHWHPG